MKHLMKFNENVEKIIGPVDVNSEFEFDEEYIKECFIEFYDNPTKYDVYEEGSMNDDEGEGYIEYKLGINCPDLEMFKDFSIEEFLKVSEEYAEFYKEISTCIDKVRIKYPDLTTVISQDNHKEGQGPISGTRFMWVKFRMETYIWN